MAQFTNTYNFKLSEAVENGLITNDNILNGALTPEDYYSLSYYNYDLEVELTITADTEIQGAIATAKYYVVVPEPTSLHVDSFGGFDGRLQSNVKTGDSISVGPDGSATVTGSKYTYTFNQFLTQEEAIYDIDDVITIAEAGRHYLGKAVSDVIEYNGSQYFLPSLIQAGSFERFFNETSIALSVYDAESEEVIDEAVSILAGTYITDDFAAYPTLYYPATGTASVAYLGNYSTITLFKKQASLPVTVRYEFGSLRGDAIATPTKDISLTWQIPFEFLNEFDTTELSKSGTLIITTFDKTGTTAVGSSTCEFTVLIDGDSSAPIIEPTYEAPTLTYGKSVLFDETYSYLELTGDSTLTTVIRYQSNVEVTPNITAQNNATVTSRVITWDKQKNSGTAETAEFTAVETDTFIVEAVDSRGLISRYTYIIPEDKFIPYTKLTTNLTPNGVVSVLGELSLDIQGNCFNGSFGAMDNYLKVYYRYKTKNDIDFGSWIEVEGTIAEHYAYTVSLTGLDYKEEYTFQVKAEDAFYIVESPEVVVVGRSIFDWGKHSFDFNVPVRSNEDLSLAVEKGIYVREEDGSEHSIFIPRDSTGNTVIGYSNYSSETGETLVYGRNIHLHAAEDITLNGVSLLGTGYVGIQHLMNALGKAYSFTASTVSMGPAFTSVSCSLTLRGNCLYCRVYGSRGEASGTGDFTDELIANFSFNHGGKITGMDYVSGVTGSSGPTAGIMIKNPQIDGDNAYFDVYLTNAADAGRNFLAAFVIPVSIDLSQFAE